MKESIARASTTRLTLADIEPMLESIAYIEGSLTVFPCDLKEQLRSHARLKGLMSFVNQCWSPAVGSLVTRGRDGAHFQLEDGTVLTELGRFAILGPNNNKHQIIVAILPYKKKLTRIIVLGRCPSKLGFNNQLGHTARTWKTWKPDLKKHKSFQCHNILQISYPLVKPGTPEREATAELHLPTLDQKQSRQPSLNGNESSLSQKSRPPWSPSTTESDPDESRRALPGLLHQSAKDTTLPDALPPALDRERKTRSTRTSLKAMATSHAYRLEGLPDPYDDEEMEEEETDDDDNSTENELDKNENYPHAITSTEKSGSHRITLKLASYQTRVGQAIPLPTLPGVGVHDTEFKGPPSATGSASTSKDESVIKIGSEEPEDITFNNIMFVFRDPNDKEQSRSSFAACDSGTALFDEALAADIGLTTNTRMLIIQADDLPETNVRVAKRTVMGFDDKILAPLRTLLHRKGNQAKIEVIVKHHY